MFKRSGIKVKGCKSTQAETLIEIDCIHHTQSYSTHNYPQNTTVIKGCVKVSLNVCIVPVP